MVRHDVGAVPELAEQPTRAPGLAIVEVVPAARRWDLVRHPELDPLGEGITEMTTDVRHLPSFCSWAMNRPCLRKREVPHRDGPPGSLAQPCLAAIIPT